MKESLRVPAIGLLMTARGVCFKPSLSRCWATPGASRCSSGRRASGVRSRRPNPVPPEVSTRSTCKERLLPVATMPGLPGVGLLPVGLVHWVTTAAIASGSSGTIAVFLMTNVSGNPSSSDMSFSCFVSSGILLSSYTPRDALSLMESRPTLIVRQSSDDLATIDDNETNPLFAGCGDGKFSVAVLGPTQVDACTSTSSSSA
mmetsp:Transcript_6263/g.10401  ORF Transcript_6263/g.10401 Transcript_6263/m.10401 type:complete len:202 (-) Transcript_6263:223-828(-)